MFSRTAILWPAWKNCADGAQCGSLTKVGEKNLVAMQSSSHGSPEAQLPAGTTPHPVTSAELLLSMIEARYAPVNGHGNGNGNGNGNGHGNGHGNGIDSRAFQELEQVEKQIAKLHEAAADEGAQQEVQHLHDRMDAVRKQVAKHSTAWVKTELARHPQRPYALDYIERIFTDWSEIHGDRGFADDPAIICGMAFSRR